MRVGKDDKSVEVKIERRDGSDGKIMCKVKTETLTGAQTETDAKEFDDFVPYDKDIVFEHGETEGYVKIELCASPDDDTYQKELKAEQEKEKGTESGDGEGDSENEEPDLMFQIKLLEPRPEGVKISKMNNCIVTIVKSEDSD